jgi:hypothetical protein
MNVKILPIKVLGNDGYGTSCSVANGIAKAVEAGADIINLSLGGGKSSVLDSAVKQAVAKGVAVVTAAGNENDDTSGRSPANLTEAIVVSSVNQKDERWEFSNFGKSVDIAAPGVDIKSSVPGGGFGTAKDSSGSISHATAAIALLLAEDPARTPAMLEKRIVELVDDKGPAGWDKEFGYGIINLGKDLPAEPPATPTATPTPTAEPTPDPGRTIVEYKWSVDEVSLTMGGDAGSFSLLAVYDDGSTADATKTSTFGVGDESIAKMPANGTLEAAGVGETYVWLDAHPANCLKLPGPLPVKVALNLGYVKELKFEKESFSIGVGESEKIAVIGVFDDLSEIDVTEQVHVGSTESYIAEVKDGILYGVEEGVAHIYIVTISCFIKLPEPVAVTVTADS